MSNSTNPAELLKSQQALNNQLRAKFEEIVAVLQVLSEQENYTNHNLLETPGGEFKHPWEVALEALDSLRQFSENTTLQKYTKLAVVVDEILNLHALGFSPTADQLRYLANLRKSQREQKP